MPRRLRSGYTTGACAAAAAKAALLQWLEKKLPSTVEIPFPDGSRHGFAVQPYVGVMEHKSAVGVIKDAGDDPDVTNRALICAAVDFVDNEQLQELSVSGPKGLVYIQGGQGVGRVTKPGLAVSVGQPAINPGPRQMIEDAVLEGLASETAKGKVPLVTVFVPKGEELAKKTLNSRLGIIGGLSILGTTGIVRPVSADAWTATIKASLNVAKEAKLKEVVLSTGRTSERGVQRMLSLPEEAYAMMGDYLEFSLKDAASKGFEKIHLAGMWAKIMKAALETPQTHVRHGAFQVSDGADLLVKLGVQVELQEKLYQSNTARQMYDYLRESKRTDLIKAVCLKAKEYCQKSAGLPVTVYLVDSGAKVVEHV